jgi:hypothetical protein
MGSRITPSSCSWRLSSGRFALLTLLTYRSAEQYVTGILKDGKLQGSWLSPDRVGKPLDTAKGLETFSIPVCRKEAQEVVSAIPGEG